MNGKTFSFLVAVVLLSGLWPQQQAAAIDGDMVYSAPYVIFNEETGKLETVNPGPRLKAHEAETAAPAGGEPGSADTMSAARPVDTDAALPNEPNLRVPALAAVASLLMAAGGFLIWKTKSGAANT